VAGMSKAGFVSSFVTSPHLRLFTRGISPIWLAIGQEGSKSFLKLQYFDDLLEAELWGGGGANF